MVVYERTEICHRRKPSETTWPAKVAVMPALSPAHKIANAKRTAAPTVGKIIFEILSAILGEKSTGTNAPPYKTVSSEEIRRIIRTIWILRAIIKNCACEY